ncbi:ATP-dependent helicase HrpB [Luteitalea sp. TBR-22]|uniref:ATP-dependent RNA helicase n=1 Tax=Luteitalea sp. TBR-22 TaxID=2802971 RepID=UPI001AF5E4C5|nr:ATP-dependent helicase C-terminal domain-containing protein [Luteitalea sp. TBR-22]BCS35601.1 ATP-dependent helicase HrpB [Luteitalea sp. TBR-22]
MSPLPPLPIDAHLDAVREALRAHRAAVLVATPGAGKTTRVPPALAGDGQVLVLQPRRAAARALARRVAEEQGWTLGREVGWHVRFEPRFSRDTRVLFATEGILTARLQQDPLLDGIRTVVLDEFHERSVHADLGLALVKQAWLARDDLRVLVMSATLDAGPVSAYLADCPVIEVPGDAHPLAVTYAPDRPLSAVVDDLLLQQEGNVLCFLPGAREIDDAQRALTRLATSRGVQVLPLHGALPPDAQDAVLLPGRERRVVLATNIAETSVTVPGVRAVVDTGWQKVARYDAARGIDTLQSERVTRDAADQRAGRAARLGPGVAVRLWDERDRLRPFRDPDITRIDLAPVLLAILAWGGRLDDFEWFDAPPAHRQRDAIVLLERLGAAAGGSVTALGRRMARMPLPPRLARLVLAADAHPDACLAAALLGEGRLPTPDGRTTSSDLLSLLPGARALPHLARAASAIGRAAADEAPSHARQAGPIAEDVLGRAVLAGFPDRVAQRRVPNGEALLLATGTGARLSAASGVREALHLVALEVRTVEGRDAQVSLASAVEKDWLTPTGTTREPRVDEQGRLRVVVRRRYHALTLSERQEGPGPDDHGVLAAAWFDRPRSEADTQLLARLAFCGIDVDLPALVREAAASVDTLAAIDIEAALPWGTRQRLLTEAPARLPLPSGRTAALTYTDDGSVRAAVKLQELFGLAETPRLGPRREPVLFELLAPNGRPVQSTRDLRSFWTTTYAEVRKELRGRYPKHPWPEDPWTATPTHRTKGHR